MFGVCFATLSLFHTPQHEDVPIFLSKIKFMLNCRVMTYVSLHKIMKSNKQMQIHLSCFTILGCTLYCSMVDLNPLQSWLLSHLSLMTSISWSWILIHSNTQATNPKLVAFKPPKAICSSIISTWWQHMTQNINQPWCCFLHGNKMFDIEPIHEAIGFIMA